MTRRKAPLVFLVSSLALAAALAASPAMAATAALSDSAGADSVTAAAKPSSSVIPTTVSEGDWIRLHGVSSTSLPGRRMHTPAIYDPAGDRMIVFGGWDGSHILGDLQAMTIRPSAEWSPLPAAGTPPAPRYAHTAIYDPLRSRIVYFGGSSTGGLSDEVWELTLGPTPAWNLLAPAGPGPTPRAGHSAVYDSVRDRMLVYGGNDGVHKHEVWALSFSPTLQWTLLTPTGTSPGDRSGHIATYDAAHDQMVIFGGADALNYLNTGKILAFDGGPHWLPLPAGPGRRTLASAVYDPGAGGTWMFGGVFGNGSGYQDVWFLQLGASPVWTQASPGGTPPTPRWGHSALLDPVANRMLVFGGVDLTDWLDETWGLSLAGATTWSRITPGAPPNEPLSRYGHTLVKLDDSDRLLIFGGTDDSGIPIGDASELPLASPDVWVPVSATGTPPARFAHASVYDSKRNREIVLAGFDTNFLNDAWTLDLASPAWNPLVASGTPPSPRDALGAVYDPIGDRVVLFGGWDGTVTKYDVWSLWLDGSPHWTLETPSGPSTPGRSGFGFTYDGSRHSMWVIGGETSHLEGSIDVWRLSLDSPMHWIPVAVFGTPPSARWGHSLVYDAAHDRLLLFGGVDLDRWYNDVWQLTLSGTPEWSKIVPAGAPPGPRLFAGAVLDPSREWLIVDGGVSNLPYNDTWALRLDQPTPALASWVESQEIPDGVRLVWSAPEGTVAEIQRRTENSDWSSVGFATTDGSGLIRYDDHPPASANRYGYRLEIGDSPFGEAWVELSSRGLELAGFATNPLRQGSAISFRLANGEPAALQVFDLRGRSMFRRNVGGLGPGEHTVAVDGAALRAGVYWIRLSQGASTRKIKAVVLP